MHTKKSNKINNQIVTRLFFILICLSFSNSILSQTEFFNSRIKYSDGQLVDFYTSFSIDSTQIFFNANDYNIYAFDKKTGILNWSNYIATKSDNPPKVYQNNVFVRKHLGEYENRCVQLNAKTGDTIQTLTIESINTQPYFKGDIMYCTAISQETGGIVLAYDLKKNSIIWEKFIAHGVDRQPYYFKDKIITNAEEDNWFELDYNGKFLDNDCEKKSNLFVEDIKCVRNFKYLTHNQKEMPESYFETYEGIKLKYTKDKTFALGENKLLVINNRNKIDKEIKLEEIVSFLVDHPGGYIEILKTEVNTVWFLYKDTLIVYDHKSDKILKTYDLTQWSAHQAILENNNLWLISRKDGQLVGLKLE